MRAAGGRPGGGGLLLGCRACGVSYPLAVGARGGRPADPPPTPPRALLQARFACGGGGKRAPAGGRLFPRCGASGVGRSPTSDRPFWGCAAGARCPLAVRAGGVGVGTCRLPQSARSAELALRTVGAVRGCPGGGVFLAWFRGIRDWALIHARPPILRARGQGPLPTGCGCGGCGCGDPSSDPRRALLRARFARCGGGTRTPGAGAGCLGVGHPG